MRYLIGFIGAFAGMAALSTSAFGQTYDLAGVKIGMTPAQVEIAVQSKGYEPNEKYRLPKGKGFTHRSSKPNFSQKVASRKGHRVNRTEFAGIGVSKFEKDDGRERLEVTFLEYPSGPYVQSVNYRLNDKAVSKDDLIDTIYAKYGKPKPLTPEELKQLGLLADSYNEKRGRTWQGKVHFSKDGIHVLDRLSFGRSDQNKSLSLNSIDFDYTYNKVFSQAVENYRPPNTSVKGTSF